MNFDCFCLYSAHMRQPTCMRKKAAGLLPLGGITGLDGLVLYSPPVLYSN